jgi:hypothetical protein
MLVRVPKMDDFFAVQAKQSRILHLSGRIDDVFPLFDPVGEKKWSEDWNPIPIFPSSGVQEGGVFLTRHDDGVEAIWVITKLDRNSRNIVYTSFTPSFKVSVIEIECEPAGLDCTKARVTYTVTALSEKGNQYVNSFTGDYYCEWMTHWEKAINHYLQHGHALRHH